MANSKQGSNIIIQAYADDNRHSRHQPQPKYAWEYSTSTHRHHQHHNYTLDLPEKKLTLLALRLAVLEKSASGIGALGFLWATVVILGGFAITVEPADFWFVTSILLIEAARIFSRSHELEWRHHSSSSPPWLSSSSRLRTPLVDYPSPLVNWALLSSAMSSLLHWLQPLSAVACIALSLSRLVRQDYGNVAKGDSDRRNRAAALNVFYSLALAEAMLFLTERVHWEYQVTFRGILDRVGRECNIDLPAVRRFFYDAYSRSVDGSIFDGMRMDMGSFAAELLASGSAHEQLVGVRVMAGLAARGRHAAGGEAAVERLVEMVGWEGGAEARRCAAEVVAWMVKGPRDGTATVARVRGAAWAAASLLCAEEWELAGLGLRILKGLARHREGCARIASTEGLLPRVLEFTVLDERALRSDHAPEAHMKVVKLSLQLEKMLASTSGTTGRALRQEITEIAFAVSNIRDILRHGARHAKLQKLAIEILTSLATDVVARERIGCTGGVVKELIRIFSGNVQSSVRTEAGEALAMLALESEENCRRMLRLGLAEGLVAMLGDAAVRVPAGRVMRNLCAYGGDKGLRSLRGVFPVAVTMALKAIMEEENKPLQEASLGVASKILCSMSPEEASEAFVRSGIEECDLARKLIRILGDQSQPSIIVSRMGRFAVELAICMMRSNKANIIVFKEYGLEDELWNIWETTSEVELFKAFSGSLGLSRRGATIGSIVDIALEILSSV